MTIEVAEKAQAWDIFLSKETDEVRRRGIETFRATHWPNIRRELTLAHNRDVVDGVEPHWTAPGKAMFWRRTMLRHRNSQGVMVEEQSDWEPTGPLSAASAAVIAQHLGNGFSFRPTSGVEAEAAVPPADQAVSEIRTYRCEIHGTPFPTWKGYLKHCKASYEEPKLPLPGPQWCHYKKSTWYCRWHDTCWDERERRSAIQHQRSHRIGPVLVHPRLADMETAGQDVPREHSNKNTNGGEQ